MNNQILDFINRRFKKDCNWVDGNCYYFSVILKDRFPFLEIVYDPIDGHFLSYDSKSDYLYDFLGKHSVTDYPFLSSLEEIKHEDPLWYSHLERDCMR